MLHLSDGNENVRIPNPMPTFSTSSISTTAVTASLLDSIMFLSVVCIIATSLSCVAPNRRL